MTHPEMTDGRIVLNLPHPKGMRRELATTPSSSNHQTPTKAGTNKRGTMNSVVWNMTRGVVSTTLVAVFALWLPGNLAAEEAGPLPKAGDIATMRVKYYDRQGKKEVAFDVPQESWKNILASLLPARKDDRPAKWEVLGSLEITSKDRESLIVWLFTTSQEPGAFAAGKTWEQRVYYRGGKTADLEKALQAARAFAKK